MGLGRNKERIVERLLNELYKKDNIKKKRLRLERKLGEAGREIDEVFGKVSRMYVNVCENGMIELDMIKDYKIFSIDLNNNRLIFCDTQGKGENNCKIIESGDLRTLLRWILKEG